MFSEKQEMHINTNCWRQESLMQQFYMSSYIRVFFFKNPLLLISTIKQYLKVKDVSFAFLCNISNLLLSIIPVQNGFRVLEEKGHNSAANDSCMFLFRHYIFFKAFIHAMMWKCNILLSFHLPHVHFLHNSWQPFRTWLIQYTIQIEVFDLRIHHVHANSSYGSLCQFCSMRVDTFPNMMILFLL